MPVIIVKINYFITYLFDMSSLCLTDYEDISLNLN